MTEEPKKPADPEEALKKLVFAKRQARMRLLKKRNEEEQLKMSQSQSAINLKNSIYCPEVGLITH